MGCRFDMDRTIERFWSRVKRGLADSCWIWEGGGKGGYGQFWVQNKGDTPPRFSLRLKLGRELRPGEGALHECDNRRCVNPNHLFIDTGGQNNTDRCNKGRNADRRGSKNPRAKLDEKIIPALGETMILVSIHSAS